MSVRRAFLVLAMGLVAGLPAGAEAQNYPTRAIEIVVPYAPGGGTDIMVRQIVKVLEEQKLVSVPVTVANRTGGSGGREVLRHQPAGGRLHAGRRRRRELAAGAPGQRDLELPEGLHVPGAHGHRREPPGRPEGVASPDPRGASRGRPRQGQGRLSSAGPTSARSTTSRTSTSTRRRRSTSPTCPSRAAAR